MNTFVYLLASNFDIIRLCAPSLMKKVLVMIGYMRFEIMRMIRIMRMVTMLKRVLR